MSDRTPVPEYRLLNAQEQSALQQGLARARRMAQATGNLSIQQIQALYDEALLKPIDDDELIALGLAFGQHIVSIAGFDWIRIADQWGEETCVGLVGKSINCTPISMIQKRQQRREACDLQALASTIARRIQEQLDAGEVGDWE